MFWSLGLHHNFSFSISFFFFLLLLILFLISSFSSSLLFCFFCSPLFHSPLLPWIYFCPISRFHLSFSSLSCSPPPILLLLFSSSYSPLSPIVLLLFSSSYSPPPILFLLLFSSSSLCCSCWCSFYSSSFTRIV